MSTRADGGRNNIQRQTPVPKNWRGSTLVSAIVAALAVLGIIAYAWHSHNSVPGAAVATDVQPTFPPLAKVGSQAPLLTLKAPLDTITSASLAGKPYVLEIFATWCPHCQRMTSVLKALQKQFPDLTILSVTGSPYAKDSTPDNMISESQQDVDAFDSQFNVTWPTIYDKDLTVARSWGLEGFPTIYVVNKKGKIVFARSGEVKQRVLADAVRKAGA